MEKSTQRPITVARLRSKPTRDGRARRIGGTGVIVRGPGVRRTQGQHSRPSRLPGAAAASSARAGFLFGVLRRPLQARQGRQGYSSSASGRLLYSETEPRQSSPSPRAREPRRAAAASVFDVGAPGFSGLSPDAE